MTQTQRGSHSKTEIYSIFGQIEGVAAEMMVERGKANKIPPDQIPPTASVNENGDRAKFAIVISRADLREFNELIADLRA